MHDDLALTHARISEVLRRTTRRALRAAAQLATVSLASCTSGPAAPEPERPTRAVAPRSEPASLGGHAESPDAQGGPAEAHAAPAADPGSVCTSGSENPFQAAQLEPGRPVDYIAVRTTQERFSEVDGGAAAVRWTRSDFEVVSEAGKRCAGAHGDACMTRVARHPDQPTNLHCIQACGELSVVVTRGDDVERHASLAELAALLAPINTPTEALLLVKARHYDVSCQGERATRIVARPDGYRVSASRLVSTCPVSTIVDEIDVTREGALKVVSSGKPIESKVCIGRMTAGLALPEPARGAPALAAYLAESAELEACSVTAFARLTRELRHHGAPAALVRLAERARLDEVRHAREVSALACAYGAAARETACDALPDASVRSLLEIARENAVEGCVRETYGAIVGAFQAEHAEDQNVRALMTRLAADELRHAELAHLVHAWLFTRLEEHEKRAVDASARAARAALAEALRAEPEAALARSLGLPSSAQAGALLQVLAEAA